MRSLYDIPRRAGAPLPVRAALALLPALLSTTAQAGRPLSTEDASTLEDKACQFEAWVDRTHGNVTDAFVAPACSYFDTEFQFGAARTREAGRSVTSATYAQAKHVWRKVEDGAWGIGLVAGLARAPQREKANGWGDPYLLVPLSLGLGEDRESRALLHLNLGSTRNRAEGRYLTLWGMAVEKPVSERLTVLAESFGENTRKPYIRAGGRYTLADKLDVDLTYVTRAGGERDDRYWSLGVHWETSPFLP